MSVLSEILAKITGIDNSKKRIRTKLVSMMPDSVTADATLDECADAVESIVSLAGAEVDLLEATSTNLSGLLLPARNTGYIDGNTRFELTILRICYDILDGGNIFLSELLSGTNSYLAAGRTMLNGAIQGTFSSDATATAANILSGKTAYVNGDKVTGTMSTATQATPSISVSSTGLITASAEQSAGYVSAGTKSATMQLQTRGERVITPGKDSITILAGNYLTGNQIIVGSDDLIPENIRKGVTIFGVTGTYEPATGPYSILASTTSFTKPNDWTIRLTLNSQGIADGVFKSGVKYQLVIDGVSKGTVTGNGSGSIHFGTGGFTLDYNGSYIDMDLGTDISPASIDIIANVA